MDTKKISTLAELLKEQQEVRAYCKYQEKLIRYKFEEIKDNFPDVMAKQLLPYEAGKNQEISSMLDGLNGLVVKMLPARYRENQLVSIGLKLVQVLAIRGFNTLKENRKKKKESN